MDFEFVPQGSRHSSWISPSECPFWVALRSTLLVQTASDANEVRKASFWGNSRDKLPGIVSETQPNKAHWSVGPCACVRKTFSSRGWLGELPDGVSSWAWDDILSRESAHKSSELIVHDNLGQAVLQVREEGSQLIRPGVLEGGVLQTKVYQVVRKRCEHRKITSFPVPSTMKIALTTQKFSPRSVGRPNGQAKQDVKMEPNPMSFFLASAGILKVLLT